MLRESEKNLKINHLLAQIAIAQSSDEKWQKKIKNLWSSYVNLELGLPPLDNNEPTENEQEKSMLDEYNSIKHLRPKIRAERDGKLRVTGLNI